MKLTALLCALCCCVGQACAQEPLGHFGGAIQTPQGELPIIFHFGHPGDAPRHTMDSPAQRVSGFPIQKVRYSSDGNFSLQIPQIGFTYRGIVRNDSLIEGSVTQNGHTLPLTLRRIEWKDSVAFRPGTPEPPYPYREEEVVVRTADSTTLAGTLVVPEGEGPFPALLLITGSGAQDRNEEMWNYQPFFMIADHLARQGFATLRMDDRGTGKSGGNYAGSTLQSATADAECALDYLRRRPEADPERTGLIGHSMGGTIAFRIAARRPQDVACVVALAGATQKGKDWMMEQCEKSVLQLLPAATGDSLRRSYAGLYGALSHSLPPDSARERCLPYMLDIWQRLDIFPEELRKDLPESRRMDNARFLLRATITPEFASLVQYDPTDDLKRTACPVWAAYGEKDMQVVPERNLQAIEAHTMGNPHVTTRVYPGLNHLFLPARTGLPTEYPELKGNFSPQVLQDMAEWLKQNINL